MIASFLFVQLLALAVGSEFIAQKISVVKDSADNNNAIFFFGYVLFSAVVLLLVLRFYSGNLLFVFLEFVLLFFSMQILFSLVVDSELVAAGAALLVTLLRFKFPYIRALLLLLASAVVGALLGSSLDIVPAVILSALLAGYDVIAVFYTKHMVTLAKGLSARGAAFSIQITAEKKIEARTKAVVRPALKLPKGDAAYSRGIATKVSAPTTDRERDSVETIELGTGDLVIPAMLLVSALKLDGVGTLPLHAIAAFAGSVLGIAGLFWVLERQRGYWPALPPLVFGALLGLAALQVLIVLKVV
jgi:presenilin-like A22 family membrane protease